MKRPRDPQGDASRRLEGRAGPRRRRAGCATRCRRLDGRAGRHPLERCARPLGAAVRCLGLLLGLAACATPGVRPKGFREATSTWEALEASLAPQRWAVVIGIPTYRDPTFTPLRYTVADATELARVLRDPRFGGFDHVISRTTPETTTREAVLFELRRLAADLRRQDTLLVYFSGHGTLEVSPDDRIDLYLAASDTRSYDLPGTAIDLLELRDFLAGLKTQRTVMMLDSCFAGQGRSRIPEAARARIGALSQPFQRNLRALGDSEALLMASTVGGVALEDDRLGHGTYTTFLLEALTSSRALADTNHDGAITPYEAHDYARVRVAAHTQDVQVPEGFFRMVGRADIYLSGHPDPALASASALIYAYGLDAGRALRVLIDGRAKGSFPQAIAVEPGPHQVTLRDEQGRVVADGRLEFARGQVYPLGLLVEELQGYRRFFGLEAGGTIHDGPVETAWGDRSARIGVISGYRLRGGALRGLSLSFHLGYTPAGGGDWLELSRDDRRPLFDLDVQLVMRRSRGRFHGGVGWHVGAIYTSRVQPAGSLDAIAPERLRPLDAWLTIPTGPVLWEGYAIDRSVLVTLEQAASWFPGAFDGGPARANLLGRVTVGLEMGF